MAHIQSRLSELEKALAEARKLDRKDLLADVEVFHKGVVWALRYDKDLSDKDKALILHSIDRGIERARTMTKSGAPWEYKASRLVRGYVSNVDSSTQPYGLVIPASYKRGRPIRLDVVLHGSTRPVGLSELRFMAGFDEGDGNHPVDEPPRDAKVGTEPIIPKDPAGDRPIPTQEGYIELHPLGRVENCYRWAGEADVFEAIEDVCSKYWIDRRQIVLRGMSMGASGTWHLGLKHPDFFIALGPYCGYVDTHRFSETPGMNFVTVGPLPPYQEAGLHMLDSVDYAANAGIVPCIACMGEKDPFFQAHVIMGAAMKREGIQMVNLISPGTGHVIDPVTFKEQMDRVFRIVQERAGKPLAMANVGEFDAYSHRAPNHIRFVTWTLKYSRCFWINLTGLDHHYRRAEIQAERDSTGNIRISRLQNINRFELYDAARKDDRPVRIQIAGQTLKAPIAMVCGFERRNGRWTVGRFPNYDELKLSGKKPGLQGPIDDAFTRGFLCVRGTGKPWNPAIQAWSDANLKRFAYEWNRYFRGELPIKSDTDVTQNDLRFNLILFGDPGSNVWIRKALSKLPVQWTKNELRFGQNSYSASDHAPALIMPSPWGYGSQYLVINSGHSFHEAELNRLNYLLFPRLGDWTVLKVGPNDPTSEQPYDAAPRVNEEVIQAGFFDEQWKLPRDRNVETARAR